MKTVILAGGLGTRLSEETTVIPKPMVEIGGKPILWHILSHYASYGFDDFVIATGYKGEAFKEYFANFFLYNSDLYVDLGTGETRSSNRRSPGWRVHCVDTGLEAMTGGRLLRLREHIDGETFMVTYGDGVGDIDIGALVDFHRAHGRIATVTAVHPPARFGGLNIGDGDIVTAFTEKPAGAFGWINGGFFVFEPQILDYIDGDEVPLEQAPLARLADAGELVGYRHEGFWKPMDTLRELNELRALWDSGAAPWKTW